MGRGVVNDVFAESAFYRGFGKIAEKNTFCCFELGIHGMTKIDLAYLIENFAGILKMVLEFSQNLFFIEL